MRRAHRSARLFAALALSVAGRFAVALDVDAAPAWNGYAAADAVTELRVTLTTPGAATIEARQPGPRPGLRHRWRTEPGVPRTVYLPVLSLPGHRNTLELTVDGRPGPPLHWSPRWLTGVRLVATTLAGAVPERDRLRYLGLAPGDLPRVPEAYRTAAATVVDGAGLEALTAGQRAAIAGHVAACGRVLLVGQSVPLWEALRVNAGCGGRGLRRIARGQPVHEAVLDLLEIRLPPPPDPAAAVRDMTVPVLRQLALFLTGYLLLVAMAAWRLQPWTPLAVTLGAALLAAAAWYGPAPRLRWLTPEDGTAAMTPSWTSLVTVGAGRGDLEIRLPRNLGLPMSVRGFDRGWLTLDHDQPHHMMLASPAALLSAGWLHFMPMANTLPPGAPR